ncbi:HIT family protein, partial [Lacticaseibacillus paracasei]
QYDTKKLEAVADKIRTQLEAQA